MKKALAILFTVSIMISGICFPSFKTVYANTENEEDIERQLSESVEMQLESLNLERIEDIYNELAEDDTQSFYGLLTDALNGEFTFSFNSVFELTTKSFTNSIKSKYKLLLIILLIAFLSALLNNMVVSNKSSDFSSSISFIFVVLIAGVVCYSVLEVITETKETLSTISRLAETITPILLALMVSVGAVSSSALYHPAVSAMTSIVIDICASFLLVLIVFMFAITILGSLVDRFKLDKLNQFCSSLLKWIITIVFTLFIGYLSIQGVMASGYDGLSIKTAKYAIRSYIPVVGGYLSEGFEIFRGGSVLIKNSLGLVGVVLLISIVLSPLIELVALNLTFKLASSFTEMIGAGKITNLLSGVTKIFSYLIAIIFAVFMMCFILFLLIIMTANIV